MKHLTTKLKKTPKNKTGDLQVVDITSQSFLSYLSRDSLTNTSSESEELFQCIVHLFTQFSFRLARLFPTLGNNQLGLSPAFYFQQGLLCYLSHFVSQSVSYSVSLPKALIGTMIDILTWTYFRPQNCTLSKNFHKNLVQVFRATLYMKISKLSYFLKLSHEMVNSLFCSLLQLSILYAIKIEDMAPVLKCQRNIKMIFLLEQLQEFISKYLELTQKNNHNFLC